MTLATGTTFASFRIIEPLGKGGMASVYKAYEASLDRYVAVKVLPAEFLHDPNFAERFSREARVVARLEHPNIIPIYAYGIDQEKRIPWMSMRMIAGGALSGVLRGSAQRLPFERSVAILAGVAEALDYAHGKGVVHRDIKPQNILLDEAGRVYLADFGIAKMVESSGGLTQTGMISGTPQYMAPEQATGLTVDNRADIYALGIVAFEMFTGHVPFVADTPVAILMKHVSEPMPLPSTAEVPEGLMRAVLKATAKKPEDRWATALDLVRGLETGLGVEPAAPAPPAATVATPRPVRPATLVYGAPTAAAAAPATWAPPRTQPAGSRTHVPAQTYAPPAPSGSSSSMAPLLFVLGGLGLLVVLGAAAGGAYFLLRPSSEASVSDGSRTPVTPPPTAAATPWQPPPGTPTPQPTQAWTPEPTATPWRPPPTPTAAPTPVSTPRPSATPLPATTAPWTPPPAPPPTQPPAPPPTARPAEPAMSAEARELADVLQGSGSADQRWKAAEALGNLGREAHGAVPVLAAALRDRNEQVRWRAAEALGKLGTGAAQAVPALIDALDRSDMLAQEAAKALGRMGSAARPAVSALASALTRSDVYLKREAAKALVKLGPDAQDAVPTLIEALGDKDKTVRAESCKVLGRIGPGARAAVPALQAALRDKDDIVRVQAEEALRRIGS